jgi:hypothetical protein
VARRSGPGPIGPGPPSPLHVPGLVGPAPPGPVTWTSRPPDAPGSDKLSESAAEPSRSRLTAPRRCLTGGARDPSGRCAAAGVVTWRRSGPEGGAVLPRRDPARYGHDNMGDEGGLCPPFLVCSMGRLLSKRQWPPVVQPNVAQQVPMIEPPVPALWTLWT